MYRGMGQQPEYAALVDKYNTIAKVVGRPLIVSWEVTPEGGIKYTYDVGDTWVLTPYDFYGLVESMAAGAAARAGQSYTMAPYPFPAGTGADVTPEYIPAAPPPEVTVAPLPGPMPAQASGTSTAAEMPSVPGADYREFAYGLRPAGAPGPVPQPVETTPQPIVRQEAREFDPGGLLLIGGAALLLILLLRR
jgi:hypothetical protein